MGNVTSSCAAINRAGDLLAASGGRGITLWQLPSTRYLGLVAEGALRQSVQFDWQDRVVFPMGADLQTIELARLLAGWNITRAARLLESMLLGTKPSDPVTYVAVAAAIAVVALAASYVPARRAASIDPLVALRQE